MAVLAASDGTILNGRAFGAPDRAAAGELYVHGDPFAHVETLTDPASRGRVALFAYPHAGNAGVARDDMLSPAVQAAAAVAREACRMTSNWRGTEVFADFLARFDVPGIDGIDTRMLARRAQNGPLHVAVGTGSKANPDKLLALAKQSAVLSPADPTAFTNPNGYTANAYNTSDANIDTDANRNTKLNGTIHTSSDRYISNRSTADRNT